MSAPDWSVYDKCAKPMCRARAGEPCIDARSGSTYYQRGRTVRRPHSGRAKRPKA